ncbi:ABC transporter ATP-binding protein [Stigmatella sp. ncwal1]|uniref:ABC transporter ATP-binding protein n=1 Tax=Stigmatella ashevillensis TaxID=2995309 RepID=A0ABT5DJ38_9BACT|nr:ABC transporter ATP-binding protein [Stigmatella ashevillena]MDC0713094.1 ABC transporter ATP-binding protein [Stigmatella ashevillena]
MSGAGTPLAAAGPEARRVPVSWLWRYLRPFQWVLFAAVMSVPLITLVSLLQPYLLKVGIDEYIAPKKLEGLHWLALLLVLLVLGEYLLRYLQFVALHWVGHHASHELRKELYQHVLRMRASFFEREPVGRLMSRFTSDCEAITEALVAGVLNIIADLLLAVGIVIAMFLLDAQLALIALATAPLLFLATELFRKLLQAAYREAQKRNGLIHAFLQEQLSGIKVIQVFRREQTSAQEFQELNQRHQDAQGRIVRWDVLLFSSVEALASIAVAGLIWWGGRRIFAETLSFGVLAAMVEYLNRFYTPIRDLSSKFGLMGQAVAASERLSDLRARSDFDAVVRTETSEARPAGDAPALEFKQVSFEYVPGQPVLRDINLRLERGQSLAIVGRTGSGKTSLVRLLTRLYEPCAGGIAFHGRDLRAITREELRTRMTLVPQEVYLFRGTLLDNLTLWNQAISPERIQQVASRLGLDEVLKRRGSTLDSQVDERGANFSAGERQLIAFARTLLCDPEVLVLDEATANVDPETERLVEAGVRQMMQGRTSIVIAHRLSTVERADAIAVLDQGVVAEMGTHAELLRRNGPYAALLKVDRGGKLDLD